MPAGGTSSGWRRGWTLLPLSMLALGMAFSKAQPSTTQHSETQNNAPPAATMPPDLTITSGHDDDFAIDWTRITLLAEQPASSGERPALTVECAEKNSHRRIDLYFDFGDGNRAWSPPPEPDPDTHRLRANPTARLSMSFHGYRNKTFKEGWEVLPSHEYKYRAPGLRTSNLEDVWFFLRYMYAVPSVRIGYADRKVSEQTAEFQTAKLIAETGRAALCRP
jgi:hypothetical protein